MAENSKIEWTDHTFNPWVGCEKVSPGCANCYAEGWAKRSGQVLWGPGAPRKRTSSNYWRQPLLWDADAKKDGRRLRVFSASLADWLDDEVPIEWLGDLFDLIHRTPNLNWLLLTKRPQNWQPRIKAAMEHLTAKLYSDVDVPIKLDKWLRGTAWPNVWIGTTVEDQQRADERIPALLAIPARVRFLSCEPLLGPVNLSAWLDDSNGIPRDMPFDWVIAGGESGSNARPMHPDWARALRDQCSAADVPFFFKQWGEYEPFDASHCRPDLTREHKISADLKTAFAKVGKKKAGRLLDGSEWNKIPMEGGAL